MVTALAVAASCGGMKKSELRGISVSSASNTVKVGSELQLTANLQYPPPRGPLNKPNIRWTSSNNDVAEVGSTGIVRGKRVGMANITATLQSKTATIAINVVADRVLTSLAIDDVMKTVSIGMTSALVARGLYSDGSNAIVTDATWTSSDPTTVRVSTPPTNAVGGLVVGLKAGMATITASFGGFSATSRVTVSGAT
ncbi:MAG TPA: Ig-like domain-containing protein, partial [Polyangia bacterium]